MPFRVRSQNPANDAQGKRRDRDKFRKLRDASLFSPTAYFHPILILSAAQDRAFRIGQTKNVKVFRLVSTGTIEELKYLRQVYKTQLQKETIVDLEDTDRAKSKRLFRGVEGDKSRKGELFGIENLLKFKDGHFMNYASKVEESKQYGVGVHGTEDLLEQVKDMDEEELADIGADGNIFSDLAQATEKGRVIAVSLRFRVAVRSHTFSRRAFFHVSTSTDPSIVQ